MKRNLGNLDKVLRVLIALAVGVLFLTGMITGVPGVVLVVVAAILVLTALFNFCPIYRLFGWSTCRLP